MPSVKTTAELIPGDRITHNLTVGRRMDSPITVCEIARAAIFDDSLLRVAGYTDANPVDRLIFRAVDRLVRWSVEP